MNVSTATSYRKIRLRMLKIASGFSFNFIHLKISSRIAFLWQMFVMVSCMFPWFAIEGLEKYFVFSRFLGGVGVFLSLSILGSFILMFSTTTKEIIKFKLWVRVSDPVVMIFFGIFQTAILIMSLSFVRSLSAFTKDIIFYEAPVFTIFGSILLFSWGILAYREQKKEVLSSLYIENSPTTDAQFEEYRAILEKGNDKSNMTLPI